MKLDALCTISVLFLASFGISQVVSDDALAHGDAIEDRQFRSGRFGNFGFGRNRNRTGTGTSSSAVASIAASTAIASTSAAVPTDNATATNSTQSGQGEAGGNGANGGGTATGGSGGGTASGSDPQTSLTLDQSVIQDTQANPNAAAGQAASLTSANNFINFCVGQTITNGLQVKGGSCNPIPMGQIPSNTNIPSAKFVNPANGATIPANQNFNIQLATQNIQTGDFTNAQKNYYSAPQQLNGGGQIIGHVHVVVQALDSLSSTNVLDPTVFTFFKGIDQPAQNGVSTASVNGGVPAGAYRLCSITSSSNHQPALAPVAQHGNIDDCVYFTAQ